MYLEYELLEKELIQFLETNRIWVLSTTSDNHVSSRSMSIINKGLEVYFQTNLCYVKAKQMNKNPNVSLCCSNVSIEGIATKIGNWSDKCNHNLRDEYKSVHPGSYESYGTLDGQVVYKVVPEKIKIWKYVNGTPIRQNLYIKEKRAEQLEFM